MQISKFISIPTNEKSSGPHPYTCYAELLLSLITGIIVICCNTISQFVVVQSEFEVLYLFSVLVIGKAILPINYMLRQKNGRTRLGEQARIDISGLFIPAFIKSLLYFGLMMLLMYMGWLLVLLPILLSLIGMSILRIWLSKKNQTFLPQQLNNTKDYEELKKRERTKAKANTLHFKQIIIQILLIISLFLHVQYFEVVYNAETVISICFSGTLCLLAFYYMHHRVFELYQSDVDQVLAKQYPIQLFNFLLYIIIYCLTGSKYGQKQQKSPGFLFILEYPIHTAVVIGFSIIYEYLTFQMMKKSSPTYLFMTQISGILWYNIFTLRQGLTASRYFSTFFSLMALMILTKIFEPQKLLSHILRLKKWWFDKKVQKQTKMIQQLK